MTTMTFVYYTRRWLFTSYQRVISWG